MKTYFMFTSTAFSPTPAELDPVDPDFINDGLYAMELADFIVRGLEACGHDHLRRGQDDWGHYIILKHDRKFELMVGCSNTEDTHNGLPEHRVFLRPDKPVIRRFFRKIDVSADVESLSASISDLLENDSRIGDLRMGDEPF